MGFRIHKEMRGDIAILHMHGALAGGPPASVVLPEAIRDLVESKIRHVVIDMEKVNRINSTGLGILIRGLDVINHNGGNLRLARLNTTAEDVMVMTKLDSVFNSYRTLEGAVRNFDDAIPA